MQHLLIDFFRRISQDSVPVTPVPPGPSNESVSQMVTKVMTRVRRITLCDPAESVVSEMEKDDDSPDSNPANEPDLKRTSSCPNLVFNTISVSPIKTVKSSGTKNKLRFSSGTQTDPSLEIKSYETLFPFALPLSGAAQNGKPLPPPQKLLESYLDATASPENKDLQTQIMMLKSQVNR